MRYALAGCPGGFVIADRVVYPVVQRRLLVIAFSNPARAHVSLVPQRDIAAPAAVAPLSVPLVVHTAAPGVIVQPRSVRICHACAAALRASSTGTARNHSRRLASHDARSSAIASASASSTLRRQGPRGWPKVVIRYCSALTIYPFQTVPNRLRTFALVPYLFRFEKRAKFDLKQAQVSEQLTVLFQKLPVLT